MFAAALTFGVNAEDGADTQGANDEIQLCEAFNGFYGLIGIHASDAGMKTETTDVGTSNRLDAGVDTRDHNTGLGATLGLGYSRKIRDRFFAGIEALIDMRRASCYAHAGIVNTTNRCYEFYNRVNGFIPSLSLLLGCIDPETKILTYFKAGANWSKVHTKYEDVDARGGPLYTERSVAKYAPTLALGIARPFTQKAIARLEVEYKFATNGKVNYKDPGDANWKGTIKVTNRDAITLKLLFVRNIYWLGGRN